MDGKSDPLASWTYSEKFRDSSANLVFESSDQVRFRIHPTNLEVTSGFTIPGLDHDSEDIVKLEESAQTLELLFTFVYPSLQTSLVGVSWDVFLKLAEAAEKYQVYSAINLCVNARMAEYIHDEPCGVLQFTWLHDYEDLMERAAARSLELSRTVPLEKMIKNLTSKNLLTAWILYLEHFRATQLYSATRQDPHPSGIRTPFDRSPTSRQESFREVLVRVGHM